MILIKAACKSYAKKNILHDVSLQLKQGESCGLLGGNGAGKSTLIKSIMGLIDLDSGSIKTRGRLSFLPEQAYLPENMTAWQLISFACKMQGCSRDEVDSLLEEVALDQQAWQKKINQYSKGMRQRTAIAYALVGSPDFLVLDEPMSGLDAMGRMHILDVFKKRHQQGAGILMCSHIVTDMVRLCDAVLILADGEVKEKMVIESDTIEQADVLEKHLKQWSGHETVA